jgi:tetratricopeptide (TPR) repeat protein
MIIRLKAIDAYKEAIKIKPDYHEVYYNMGVTYNGLGKYQKAIDAYKEAIKIKPVSVNGFLILF